MRDSPVPDGFLQRRLISPLLSLLKQGITPEKLALSVALGFSFGIFPMLGTTTLLCLIFGFLFRVNQPAIQIVNYFTYPLQLALFIPFFQLGARLFAFESVGFSVADVYVMMSDDWWLAVRALWWANVRAVAAWMLLVPFSGYLLYRLLIPVFRRMGTLHRLDSDAFRDYL